MNETKSYEMSGEETMMVVSDLVAAYETSTLANEATYLSDDILIGAVRCAEIARKQGRMIPNGQVYRLISERLGWK